MEINIDPVIFQLGPLQVRWYGLMYVLGFVIGTYIFKKFSKEGFFKFPAERADSLITHLLIGMFLGARIFYVFIYNWDYYSNHFSEILAVWKGGLSFHGAFVGMMGAILLFARKNKVPFLQVADGVVVAGSLGIFFGRMGNFINGELWGRATDVPWGMIFPSGGPYPRHPSQLYEAILEGLLIFSILWFLRPRVKTYGTLSWLFVFLYGLFRYFVEFFREADSQLGYYFGGTTTMGQILCIIMMLASFIIPYYAKKNREKLKV